MNSDVIYMRQHCGVRLEHPNYELTELFWIRWVRWPFYLCIHDSKLQAPSRFIKGIHKEEFAIPALVNREISDVM